jgi:hypothetical protein
MPISNTSKQGVAHSLWGLDIMTVATGMPLRTTGNDFPDRLENGPLIAVYSHEY